jgi:hypothetical protein
MNQNNITPAKALQVLDVATTPQNAGKLNREDYINIQIALGCLSAFVQANTPKEETPLVPDAPKKRGPKPKGAFGAAVKP